MIALYGWTVIKPRERERDDGRGEGGRSDQVERATLEGSGSSEAGVSELYTMLVALVGKAEVLPSLCSRG